MEFAQGGEKHTYDCGFWFHQVDSQYQEVTCFILSLANKEVVYLFSALTHKDSETTVDSQIEI